MRTKPVWGGILLIAAAVAGKVFLWTDKPTPHTELSSVSSPIPVSVVNGPIKSMTGQLVTDVGYDVELLTEQVTAKNVHVMIMKSNPCTECDVGPELVIYNVEANKKETTVLPGTSRPEGTDDSDTDSPPPTGITSYTHGYYGTCGTDDFGVWIMQKFKDNQDQWAYDEYHYSATTTDLIEDDESLYKDEFEKRIELLNNAPSCTRLREEDQTWCC